MKTGIDIVSVSRFLEIVEVGGAFITRTFTENEIAYCSGKRNSHHSYAGKFAAKEAVSKVLRMKWEAGLNWRNIEIRNDSSGIPSAFLEGQALEAFSRGGFSELEISISHSDDYAVAVAVVL